MKSEGASGRPWPEQWPSPTADLAREGCSFQQMLFHVDETSLYNDRDCCLIRLRLFIHQYSSFDLELIRLRLRLF